MDNGRLLKESSLVEKAKDGDGDAYERLIRIYREGIYKMAYYRLNSHMDAEDLVQDVFIQAYRRLAQLKDPSLFRPWLYRITINRIRDFHRKKRFFSVFIRTDTTGEIDAAHKGPDSLEGLIGREFWGKIDAFLKRLSRLEKEVFRLRFMDHLTITEIAVTLDRHESTIKTHLYRGIEKLRSERVLLKMLERGEI